MEYLYLLIINLLFATAQDSGYCDASTKTCTPTLNTQKLIFYDVNPPEGFNLRRDVYMRFAIMLAEAQKKGQREDFRLVLPPWNRLYHWKTSHTPIPWGAFFDLDSLKSYAPVVELYEVLTANPQLSIDTLYVLQNFEDAFEGGVFKEKWEISKKKCHYSGFWGYSNVTVKEKICVKFQGKISKLWELVSLHPTDKRIMFAHGEIPLHNSYGTKSFWNCRKSMKFNKELDGIAKKFISEYLNCSTLKCPSYVSIHWRRQDFAYGRKDYVPSVKGTASQIDRIIKNNNFTVKKIFIASDASGKEMNQLESLLTEMEYEVYKYVPSEQEVTSYRDGGVAIIDQIICSHALYFVGTHESTFSFRIQEEREILGFESETTFNCLCPDKGKCEAPSKWTIVY